MYTLNDSRIALEIHALLEMLLNNLGDIIECSSDVVRIPRFAKKLFEQCQSVHSIVVHAAFSAVIAISKSSSRPQEGGLS